MLKRSLLFVFMALFLAACGTPPYESLVNRYKTNVDNLDTLAAKQPQLKLDIGSKKLEYAAEFDAISKLSGQDQQERMLGLNRRIEDFYAKLAPPAPKPNTTTQPAGSKLGGTATGAPPATAAPGGTGGSGFGGSGTPATTPPPATGGSGFGSGGTPATTPPPGTTAPAPTGGSGFGSGGTPAPATTPPPATQPSGGSGFGGQ